MGMPYIHAHHNAPVVIVRTAAADATQQPDYLMKECMEVPNNGGALTAENGVDPVGVIAVQLSNRFNKYPDKTTRAASKVTVLKYPAHGKLIQKTAPSDGRTYFMYQPKPDYLGNDNAAFMVELGGKVYKVTLKLVVELAVDYNAPICEKPKLIKIKRSSPG